MGKKRSGRRYYRRRGRWSANINNINGTVEFPEGTGFLAIDLQTNPAQNSNTVSQQYTVKNVEMTYEVESINNAINVVFENLQAYIIYVPQGMAVTETLPFNHPEYIMAYRWLGSPNYDGYQTSNIPGRNPLFIKSRLARRLQTGDRIIFLLIGQNEVEGSHYNVAVRGLVRYWTKAN